MGVRRRGAPARRPGCSGPEGCVSSTCAHAERRNRQKPGPGEAETRSPVRAHPPREALPPNEGPRGGRTGARARSPRRRRRHFVSSAQWGRVTAKRGSTAGKGRMSQAPRQGTRQGREARDASGLATATLHQGPRRVGGRAGGRGGGGSRPDRRHIGAYLVCVRSPTATATGRLPQPAGIFPAKATRCAPGS